MQPTPIDDDQNAARPFPDEAQWLQLSLPTDEPGGAAGLPSRGFVDRVLEAVAEERALDRELDGLDRELPRILLQAHAAPAPAADFVARTLAAVRDDRKARWQQVLARHVAPEPSPQFVHRTLAALAASAAEPSPSRRTRTPRRPSWWLLAAAAAALLALWNVFGRGPDEVFETQLVHQAAPTFAHAWGSSPAGVVLAHRADLADPAALSGSAPDGLWLAFAEVR